jgi:biopolymer transport protein ExbD
LSLSLSCPGHGSIIEPLSIRITNSGEIAAGTGASRQTLDSATAGANLPVLEAQLRIYKSAAQAANSPPVVQILVEPAAPYQRFIDALSRFHANGIRPYFLPDGANSSSESLPLSKPASPSSSR